MSEEAKKPAEAETKKPKQQQWHGHGQFFRESTEICNQFTVMGTVVGLDIRANGVCVITLQAGSMPDVAIGDTGRKFTSRLLIRLPSALVRSLPRGFLVSQLSPSIIRVTGRIQGIAENIEGREFLLQELVANKIELVARYAAISGRPLQWHLRPRIEREGQSKQAAMTEEQKKSADQIGGKEKEEDKPVSTEAAA